MHVLISGADGFIGRAVRRRLVARADEVTGLSRSGSSGRVVRWDPAAGELDAGSLRGFDAIIHLAGEPLVGRWTPEKRRRIRASRVEGTGLLARRLGDLDRGPRVLLSASAVGYYGDRDEEPLSEDSPPGDTFLAEVCEAWEAAAAPAAEAGIRVVLLRFGIVLDPAGGALVEMARLFRMHLGGRLGDGRQFWSWITREDAASALLLALERETLAGPVNVTAPEPVRNRRFTAALGEALDRRALLPAPAPLLRLAMGRMADEMLLCSARVLPGRLSAAGFEWRDPHLSPALWQMYRSCR